jgi:hypothetical protein
MKQNFIASVSDDYLDQIEQVVDQLRARGFEINQVLRITGVITGRVSAKIELSELSIEGITSIEKPRKLRKT